MHNQQLLDYIKLQLEQGAGLTTIKSALVGQGWTQDEVDRAILTFVPNPDAPVAQKKSIFFWKNKPEGDDAAFAPYEEIDAKRTSKLGYFFLILMVLFGFWQGNNFLSALENSIDRPQMNSLCLSQLSVFLESNSRYGNTYYGGGSASGECVFSEREVKLGIASLYQSVQETLAAIRGAEEKIRDLNVQISNNKRTRAQNLTDYQVSLLEGMANEEKGVFDRPELQGGIRTQNDALTLLQTALGEEQSRRDLLLAEAKKIVGGHKATIQAAVDGYEHDYRVYQFKQFLLSLFFVAPLFFFVWRRYHRSKATRSEYAIIWGGLVATVSLIFAQVLLVFVYQILPKQIIQELLAILAQIKILWALLYWLGFILVPLFFGYLIYLIQKKFYNKRAIMMRALKSGNCPRCSLKIDKTMNHCPVCGHALKIKCASCGAMSVSGGSFCDVCGVKKT